jgi:hypothetical protein
MKRLAAPVLFCLLAAAIPAVGWFIGLLPLVNPTAPLEPSIGAAVGLFLDCQLADLEQDYWLAFCFGLIVTAALIVRAQRSRTTPRHGRNWWGCVLLWSWVLAWPLSLHILFQLIYWAAGVFLPSTYRTVHFTAHATTALVVSSLATWLIVGLIIPSLTVRLAFLAAAPAAIFIFKPAGPTGVALLIAWWFAACSAGLAWWAWLAPLERSDGHCPACGYSRAGLPATAPCPECGASPALS